MTASNRTSESTAYAESFVYDFILIPKLGICSRSAPFVLDGRQVRGDRSSVGLHGRHQPGHRTENHDDQQV